jgi:signal transduction histidine kinase
MQTTNSTDVANLNAKPTTILLVEDDDNVRESIRAYFEDSGYAVLEAEDGIQALDVSRTQEIDLVLTDLMMPKMNGIALISVLKVERPNTPIIVVSGTGRIEEAIEAVRQGAWDYITKPIFDLGTLELTVNQVLERAYLVAQNQAYQQHLETLVIERTNALERLSEANTLLQQEIAERTRAEAAEKAQRVLAEALRDTAAALNSTLNIEEVLDQILVNLEKVVQHNIANIMLLEDGVIRLVRWRGYEGRIPDEVMRMMRPSITVMPGLQWMLENKKPLIIPNVANYPQWHQIPENTWIKSYVGAPIKSGDDVIGFIGLDSPEPFHFKAIHAEGLQAFVDQAAVAIENARLYSQAQELAALQERNRIAHDLHDAVSQTLWSAALIADTLAAQWDKKAANAQQHLETLRQLTRGALAEMRALLLELRPGALSDVELSELIRQLIQAFIGRSRIPTSLTVRGEELLPPNVQVILYRLTQEALNNVARHAKASNVDVILECEENLTHIQIKDDGQGFNPDSIPAGHLGLGIMRERADSIGSALNINSTIGYGTTIDIVWRQNPK